MSAPMPSVPSTIGFGSGRGRARSPTALFMFERGIVGDRAGQVVDRGGRRGRAATTSSAWVARRFPASESTVALGDVDVDADTEVAGEAGRRLERLVAARERGVHADHPPPSGAEEPLVLGQPALGTSAPVAVGDAVGAHTRTPTSRHASAMTSSEPSMAEGDS